MVFSKSYCPFCTKAKQALNQLLSKDQYTVLEVRISVGLIYASPPTQDASASFTNPPDTCHNIHLSRIG